jgi:hypothetical protein
MTVLRHSVDEIENHNQRFEIDKNWKLFEHCLISEGMVGYAAKMASDFFDGQAVINPERRRSA